MAVSAAIATAVTAAVGTTYSIVQGNKAEAAQRDAMKKQEKAQAESLRVQEEGQKQALDIQKRQAAAAEQNINRANRQQPDVGAIAKAAELGSAGGPAGTMLTGPQGVDPNALALGKNTLLGG